MMVGENTEIIQIIYCDTFLQKLWAMQTAGHETLSSLCSAEWLLSEQCIQDRT